MEWKIGNLTIPNRIVVAPMAGVTNMAFRVTAKEFGAGLVVCEMISDRGLIYHNKKTLSMLDVAEIEHPMSIQIFGGSKETLVAAAKFIDKNTQADIIDINMGCPVNKVVKTDAGAHWLLDPDKVYEMVAAVTDAVDKPVTVKMRTGWDKDHVYAVQDALAAERGGAAAIAMHGRTRKQMYSGHADWNILKEVKQALHIPFMANGDIRTPEDAKYIIDEVGADAVMIGRAVLGNPWIIKRMQAYIEKGEMLPEPTPREKIATAKLQLQRLIDLKGENVACREFRMQAGYFLKGIPHAARTRAKVNSVETQKEIDDALDDLIDKLEARAAKENATRV